MIRIYSKKLTLEHRKFKTSYVADRFFCHLPYNKVYFCENENLAFVHLNNSQDFTTGWGCVNMSNQLIVPFEYCKIFQIGSFLYCINDDQTFDIYKNAGEHLGLYDHLSRCGVKGVIKAYPFECSDFKLIIKANKISHGEFNDLRIFYGDRLLLENKKGDVGIVRFSKLLLEFKYCAISLPQNNNSLGLIKDGTLPKNTQTYSCEFLRLNRAKPMKATGTYIFKGKTLEEVQEYFRSESMLTADLLQFNDFVPDNGIDLQDLEWFPKEKIVEDTHVEECIEEESDDIGGYNENDDNGYQWTEEDTWDAMTDGMYGDYPGKGNVDWDGLSDAMGL